MLIPFTKMQGLGNDFVVVEEDRLSLDMSPGDLARKLCNRHYGVGSDGLVLISAPERLDCEIRFRFYNPDGSEAEMCGNGIRCFARYVKDQGIIKKASFAVETDRGVLVPTINDDNSVTVDMGAPILGAADFPFEPDQAVPEPVLNFPLQLHLLGVAKEVPVTLVSMGNPHCLIFDFNAPANFSIETDGAAIEKHPYFPRKTNVEWVRVIDRDILEVVVWERGAGFTLACGTGACASAVAAVLHDVANRDVTVRLPGGPLKISVLENTVLMTGPAEYVFTGQFDTQKGVPQRALL